MSVVQKWLSGLIGLGALYMVTQKPEAIYRAAQGLQKLTAGSVVSITTGGRR